MIRAVGLAVLVVASLAAAPVAASASTVVGDADGPTAAEQPRSTDDTTIEKSIRLHLTPGEPGEIAVTATYDVPDSVRSLWVQLPEEARDVSSDSFSVDGDRYAWDGEDDPASLRFSLPANQSADGTRSPAVSQDGQYSFVDAGQWALVTVPGLRTGWSGLDADSMTVDQNVSVDGPGSTGGEVAYLGPVEEYTRATNGQTFTMVVPERASMTESPGDVLDALGTASRQLRAGSKDEAVWLAVAPTDANWGVRGVEYGGDDAWVVADAELSDPGNVWLHEYVHTRQDYTTASSGRWTMEAAAEYYAGLLSLRGGYIDVEAFRTYLGYGERQPWSDAVLAEPTSWSAGANYLKGSLVWGAIDRQIRLETDNGATTDDVLWRLNDHDGPVSNEAVLEAVSAVSSSSTREYAAQYTETDAAPEMWSRTEHAEAFDDQPPRMQFDVQSYRVTGPFREETVPELPTLYVGETLAVTATVTNEGGTEGTYVAKFGRDDTPLAEVRGELRPAQSDEVGLQQEFSEPGTYTLTLGRTVVPVTVERPADPVVSDVSVSSSTISPGEEVTVTATFENPTDGPATGTVPLTLDGQRVGSFDVTLGSGESVTRSRTVTLDEAGGRELAVGNQTVRVDVSESQASTPGLGVAVAVAAVLLATGLNARRER